MGFLTAQDERAVREQFQKIAGPVRLVVFAAELGGETNQQTVALMREVAGLSDRITVEVLNPYVDRERAAAYGVDRTPTVIVEGAQDYGLRFLGIPAGYEFANLLDAIVAASTGEPALSAATREALAGLAEDVTIRVFATPT